MQLIHHSTASDTGICPINCWSTSWLKFFSNFPSSLIYCTPWDKEYPFFLKISIPVSLSVPCIRANSEGLAFLSWCPDEVWLDLMDGVLPVEEFGFVCDSPVAPRRMEGYPGQVVDLPDQEKGLMESICALDIGFITGTSMWGKRCRLILSWFLWFRKQTNMASPAATKDKSTTKSTNGSKSFGLSEIHHKRLSNSTILQTLVFFSKCFANSRNFCGNLLYVMVRRLPNC